MPTPTALIPVIRQPMPSLRTRQRRSATGVGGTRRAAFPRRSTPCSVLMRDTRWPPRRRTLPRPWIQPHAGWGRRVTAPAAASVARAASRLPASPALTTLLENPLAPFNQSAIAGDGTLLRPMNHSAGDDERHQLL